MPCGSRRWRPKKQRGARRARGRVPPPTSQSRMLARKPPSPGAARRRSRRCRGSKWESCRPAPKQPTCFGRPPASTHKWPRGRYKGHPGPKSTGGALPSLSRLCMDLGGRPNMLSGPPAITEGQETRKNRDGQRLSEQKSKASSPKSNGVCGHPAKPTRGSGRGAQDRTVCLRSKHPVKLKAKFFWDDRAVQNGPLAKATKGVPPG